MIFTSVRSREPVNDARSRDRSKWVRLDPLLGLSTLAIGAFGCLMVYTATRFQFAAAHISPTYDLKKQAIFMVIGVAVMIAVAAVDYRHYASLAAGFYGLSVLLLIAVYLVGHKSRGAQAWFQVAGYQFEPSEFAKVALILALAAFCAAAKGRLGGRALVAVLVLAAIPFVLIYKQPDLGTALVLAFVLVSVLVIGGASTRHLGALAGIGLVIAVAVVHFGVLKSYQEARLTSFLNATSHPSAAVLATPAGANEYNVAEAKIAVSNGGLTGQGIGKGVQTNLAYVPEQQTDFIFSAVGEQVGFVGSVLVLGLFALLLWRIWRTAYLAKDLFGTLVCVGVFAMIAFQVFENVGMAMGIMPVAGIPLPLMSYGGSSVVMTFAAIGLVMSVRMNGLR